MVVQKLRLPSFKVQDAALIMVYRVHQGLSRSVFALVLSAIKSTRICFFLPGGISPAVFR